MEPCHGRHLFENDVSRSAGGLVKTLPKCRPKHRCFVLAKTTRLTDQKLEKDDGQEHDLSLV
jgi:hypothetical protein